jgi:hypothetical protein
MLWICEIGHGDRRAVSMRDTNPIVIPPRHTLRSLMATVSAFTTTPSLGVYTTRVPGVSMSPLQFGRHTDSATARDSTR